MSIKYKIALLFGLLSTLILTVVSIFIYYYSFNERTLIFQTRLKNRALSTANVYASISDSNYNLLRSIDTAAVASLYEKSITIIGADGKSIYQYSDKPADALVLDSKITKQIKNKNEYYFRSENKTVVAIQYPDGRGNFIVGIAAKDIDGQEYLQQLMDILLISLFLSIVLSFLTGLFFAQRIIRPIQKIAAEVNLITSNNLTQRIVINNEGDELTKLAQTFNNLLDHLQESFTIQRRFISNASHEFSTPLTSISSQLEVAMQKERTPEEYKMVILSVYEDVQEMQQLTRSLLDIAKAGSQGSIDLSEIRIDEVLFKVISDVQKQNESYKAVLKIESFPEDENLLTVFGNANLLYIALKNIIENGCKYSDDHESMVTASFEKTSLDIKVSNKSDVISEADIQNIFQPFFRTISAQHKPGFGLGLTLTKRILSLHKGTITVTSDHQNGTIFSITLPNYLFFH
jgi:two-component system, OmpR family, sensor histidine kinase ArlS